VGRPRAGIPGLAGRAAASLRKLGFQLTYVGNAPATTTTTVSYPGSAQAGGADAVMNALGLAPAAQDGVSGPVSLTIGADFAGVRLPHRHSKHAQAETVSSPSGQQTIETRNAAANICSAMPAANTDVGTPP
jgi:hypothetical protein